MRNYLKKKEKQYCPDSENYREFKYQSDKKFDDNLAFPMNKKIYRRWLAIFFAVFNSPNIGRLFIGLIFTINPFNKNEIRANFINRLLDLEKVLFYSSVH